MRAPSGGAELRRFPSLQTVLKPQSGHRQGNHECRDHEARDTHGGITVYRYINERIGVPADHRTANQCICQPHDWYYEEAKQVLAIHTLTRTEDYPADERHQRHDYVEQFVGE